MKTAFDMCPRRRGLSLLSVACAAVRGSKFGERRGGSMLVGLKVEGSGGVKRSRVSPGSLCRSLGPAARSCSSSSLSAGCTAARWCLWRRDKMDDRH